MLECGNSLKLPGGQLACHTQPRAAVAVVLQPGSVGRRQNHFSIVVCQATGPPGPGGSRRLSQAARDYAAGVRQGIDEDDMIALQLGKAKSNQLSDVQEKYKEKLKQKLIEEAEAQRREQAARSKQFSLGKLAYGKGLYPESARLFEVALDHEGPFSKLGGEIQLWQALAYQACGRYEECIQVYKMVEQTHPNRAIKKQAAELRFIMEAPKLQLKPDEKINMPLLDNLDRYTPDRSSVRPRAPPMAKQKSKYEKTWEEKAWESYTPPAALTNRYVWVASIVLGVALAVYSAVTR